jgi:NitT/TauT family transport system permease protein
MSRRLDSLWFGLVLLIAWQGLFYIVGDDAISSPVVTMAKAWTLLTSSGFWIHVMATLQAFVWALVIAIGAGVVIGLALGMSKLAGEVAEPILNALYAIPKITLYPVILLMFGLGLPAKIAFGTIHGIFPVIILTMTGVRSISPVIRKTARVMRLSRGETMRTVLFPAAMPEIFSGMRVGFALTLLGTLIGELFASNRGLGFLLLRSAEQHDVPGAMALALLLFVTASAVGAGLLAIDRRLHHLQ